MDEEFVDRWVRRLRNEVPDAVAILIGGSHLRGDAGPHSDLDFDVVVPDGSREDWPGWFDESGGRIVLVSTWIRDVDAWEAARQEPQDWAFGLPCADVLRLCWAADGRRERFDLTEVVFPAGPPEIDHFAGEVGKVANAWAARDEPGLRLAAQDLARAVVSLALPLNPVAPVRGRRAALDALLSFTVAPPGYRADMLTCLGLAEGASPRDVHAASRRLALGTMALLTEHTQTFGALLPPWAVGWLRDGGLRRHVERSMAAG